ncbi:MAG: hypothetical protein Q7T97_17535 [Burkholderiaceae bacterium]|nr:hypothetical protein [Burkholderiaceae bacterium]
MLRWLVLALLLANIAFFALTRGEAVRAEREPDQRAQQVHPEAVRLLTPGSSAASAPQAASAADTSASATETAAASASAATATRCFEAGPFNAAEVTAAEAALTASPAASALAQRWTRVTAELPGTPSAASAAYRLRVDAATPEEAAVLESLPVGKLSHAFAPCAPR